MNAVAASLSPGEVFARASPDFINSSSDAFDADLRRLAALGPGWVNQGCRGLARIEPLGVYSTVTARYTCELRSRTQQAVVALSLGRNVNAWKITGFYISPPRAVGG